MKGKVYILIPAYNESKVISKVISDIKKQGFENIIVIDDGSSDNTYEVAQKSGAKVLRHFINRGKGAAVKTGLQACKILNADYVITMDGDGQHESKDLNLIFNELKSGCDVVLGSRFLRQNEMPLPNRIFNYVANILTYFFYGIKVTDSQSGFRGYNKKALNLIETQSEEYEFDTEVLREISRHNLKFSEVPIMVYYTDYSRSKNRKQGFINGLKTLYNIIIKQL
ncbi:MAG: hypothetical protein KatS3mg090_0929 [Patescibacteria group bacterium]|nr:MAG: hypothetical protein KatS3mg090_0929 [Patescibacteria group bacterium]